MGNLFECIGLLAGGAPGGLDKLAPLLEAAGDDVVPAPPYRHLRWSDPSGASVAVHTRGGVIECVTPWFAPPGGASRWRVRTGRVLEDPDCVHCSGVECEVLDGDFAVAARAAIQWLHFLAWERSLRQPRELELEVIALAEEARFFDGREPFERAQASLFSGGGGGPDGGGLRMVEDAFVPVGLLADGDGGGMSERARVMFAGRVVLAERRTVTASGGQFRRVRVATRPGPLDVLIAVDAAEGLPEVGGIAWVQGWLVARPVGPPPHHERVVRPAGMTRRNWWARMLRKRS